MIYLKSLDYYLLASNTFLVSSSFSFSFFFFFFFFFNDTAPTEIYTLSLHDALPISLSPSSLANALVAYSNAVPPPGTMPSSTAARVACRSEEHTSELQSHHDLVCRLLLEKKKIILHHTNKISSQPIHLYIQALIYTHHTQ